MELPPTHIFNFRVLKWSDRKTVQRLILTFNFKVQSLSCIHNGKRIEKIDFREVALYQSEDGLRLTIQFASQRDEYELDADTQEEKNSLCRLLQCIVDRKMTQRSIENYISDIRSPTDLEPVRVIKEGMVEIKGHGLAALMWPKRYLKVCSGELQYYKPDDTMNALNIIPLNGCVTEVKKNGQNGFTVGLLGRDRVYSFRTLDSQESEKTAEQLQDEWYQAISDGCNNCGKSVPNLKSRAITARDLMDEHAPGLKERIAQFFRIRRSSRIPTFKSFEFEDLRLPVADLDDFVPFDFQGKKTDQVLKLLKPELEHLHKILRPMTSGDSKVDILVIRLYNIISALGDIYFDETRERSRITVQECDHCHLSAVKEPTATYPEYGDHQSIAIGPALPPPPPPPPPLSGSKSLISSQLPQKNFPTPNKKLKVFNWKPLPPQLVIKSGWKDWSGIDITSSLDLSDLEELFERDSETNPVPEKRAELKNSLLKNKKILKIELFFKFARFPWSLGGFTADALDKLLNCLSKDSELTLKHIAELRSLQPTHDERELYENYDAEKNEKNLSKVELFLVELCKVPMLTERLDLLLFFRELNFSDKFKAIKDSLECAQKATKELMDNKGFVDVLQYVLAMGNYLNAGTEQGSAYGFNLSALSKLAGFCGQDRTVSLLHCLVGQLHEHQPQLLHLPQEMESTLKAKEISISGILTEINKMKLDLEQMEVSAKTVAEKSSKNKTSTSAEELHDNIKKFVSEWDKPLDELDKNGHDVDKAYKDLLSYFGQMPNTHSEEFFSHVAKFIEDFRRVSVELYPPSKSPR